MRLYPRLRYVKLPAWSILYFCNSMWFARRRHSRSSVQEEKSSFPFAHSSSPPLSLFLSLPATSHKPLRGGIDPTAYEAKRQTPCPSSHLTILNDAATTNACCRCVHLAVCGIACTRCMGLLGSHGRRELVRPLPGASSSRKGRLCSLADLAGVARRSRARTAGKTKCRPLQLSPRCVVASFSLPPPR